jgi:hypothetical protein
MNRKQFAILLVLVIIVGAAGLRLRKKESKSWESGNAAIGKKLLGDLPVNDVAHMALQQGTNAVNLDKKDDLWRVRERNDYPANFSAISDFLLKIHDVKITQSEKAGPSQLARLALAPGPGQGTNAALVIDFKDAADKPLRSLLLGKSHMKKSDRPSPMGEDESWPDGRWVKLGGNSDDVAVISDAMSNIEPKPDTWLNKDFFKVEKIRAIAVTFPVATNSWRVSRDTESGDWKLAEAAKGEQLDSSKTSGLSGALSSPAFNDVETSAKPEQLGLDKPTVVTVGTFDNLTYTVKVGQKTNDAYPLTVSVAAAFPKERTPAKDEKPDDKAKLDKEFKESQKKLEDKLAQEQAYGKWIYLVSSWSVDPVLKERGQLMVEKKEEPKKDEKPAAAAEPAASEPPTHSADIK